jgi:peroxiredoxin
MLGCILGCAGGEPNRPSVRLPDLDGRPVDLLKPDRSAVTVVVFTRTDCPISNRCASEIRRLHGAYHPRGVEFFLVYVDPRESPDVIRKHLHEYDYPCPALRDPGHALVAHCGATVTPEAVVFAKDRTMTYRGRVDDRYEDLGRPRAEPTTHDLADAIEATLQGRPVAHPRTKAVGCLIADLRD